MSAIIETKRITDILKYINNTTLVIFDVDNTLIDTVQNFGGTAWAYNVAHKLLKKGIEPTKAVKQSYTIYTEVKKFVQFKPVEPETPGLIRQLREKNIQAMVLTMRALQMAKSTVQDLRSADIDFSKQPIHHETVTLESMAGYAEGILYSGPMLSKGECLTSFLDTISYKPEYIIFVDDSKQQVENVHTTLNERGIKNHCIRYGATDEREASLDHEQANIELRDAIGEEQYNRIFQKLL